MAKRKTDIYVGWKQPEPGRWTVVGSAPRNKSKHTCWFVQCRCGSDEVRMVAAKDLRRLKSKSCGCHFQDQVAAGCLKKKRRRRLAFCRLCGKRCRRGRAKYCSRACQTGASRRGERRSCKKCGKVFWVSCGRIRSGRGVFCSKLCSRVIYVGWRQPSPGRWKVIRKSRRSGYWICECQCGCVKDVKAGHLRQIASASCGCLSVESSRDRALKNRVWENLQKWWIALSPSSRKAIAERASKRMRVWWGSLSKDQRSANGKKVWEGRRLVYGQLQALDLLHLSIKTGVL